MPARLARARAFEARREIDRAARPLSVRLQKHDGLARIETAVIHAVM